MNLDEAHGLWRVDPSARHRDLLINEIIRAKKALCEFGLCLHKPIGYDVSIKMYTYESTYCARCNHKWPRCKAINREGGQCVGPEGHEKKPYYLDAWHRGPLESTSWLLGRPQGWWPKDKSE